MNNIRKQLEKLAKDIKNIRKKIYDSIDDQLISAKFIEDRLNLKILEGKYEELSSYAATMPEMMDAFKCWTIDLSGDACFVDAEDIMKAKRLSIAENDIAIFEERIIRAGGSILDSLVNLLRNICNSYDIMVNESSWFIQVNCNSEEASLITELIWGKFERAITDNFINISRSFVGFRIESESEFEEESILNDLASSTDVLDSEIIKYLEDKNFEDFTEEDIEKYFDRNDQDDDELDI